MKCAVKGCNNNNKSKSCTISFFKFPSDAKLLEQWKSFCCCAEEIKVKTSYICIEHFKREDMENNFKYEMGFTKKRYLKHGAVPTVRVNDERYKERAQQIQKRENKKIVEMLIKQHDAASYFTSAKIKPIIGRHRRETEDTNQESHDVMETTSEEKTEDIKEFEFIAIVGDEDVKGNKELNSDKTLPEDVEDKFRTDISKKKSYSENSDVEDISETGKRLLRNKRMILGNSFTYKRSTTAGISAPTQRVRLNDTTAATVTSIRNYTENNDASLISAELWPKNVDPQMFINDENKDRCVICSKNFKCLERHYVNEHRGCEIYNSRLSPSQIKLVKQGRCDLTKVILYRKNKYYEAFCIFCQKNLRLILCSWYQHFTRHTGEFAYRCTGCGLRRTTPDFKKHHAQECPGASVSQDYFRKLQHFPIKVKVCTLCNYVQLHRSNIEKHLHEQHNIKRIFPEHIKKLVFLSSTGSGIPTRLSNNSGGGELLPSLLSSEASNTCVVDDDENDVTFDKIQPEESTPQTNPLTIADTFEELTNCHKANRDLNNSEVSPSLLLSSHAKETQQEIIVSDDDDDVNRDKPSRPKNIDTTAATITSIKHYTENNDASLVWPKNVDPQMFINDKNKYRCVICNKNFSPLVPHYVNEHRGCEIYNSRLSPSQIKLVTQGRCEIANVSRHKGRKYYEAFCIFCQENLRLVSSYWYHHFTRHTGEFAYRCTGCGLRRPVTDFKKHQGRGCSKASVARDYTFNLRVLPIVAKVCKLCNYVQLHRSNIVRHLHVQHNIKRVLPEHIKKLVFLSSTGSGIASRFSNNSAGALLPSLLSSDDSNTCVSDDDDNDVTFGKILAEETPPQIDPLTTTNKFEEFTNCRKATSDLKNSDGSPLLLISSHDKKTQEGITIGDDDVNVNNENPSLVSALGWPKNVDPHMFINDENKYRCVICNQDFIGRLVHHYVNDHRGCEIYNSRLSPLQIKLVNQGRCELFNVSVYKNHKYYEAFCIFCQKNLTYDLLNWYLHFSRHTGEFAYRCTGCGLRRPVNDFKKQHEDQECSKASVARDYIYNFKSLPIFGKVCNLCNYVQLHRSNIAIHLQVQHNIKRILPEHIEKIVFLPSTAREIATRLSENSDGALLPSLFCSDASNTCVSDDDDNDVTFDKIQPEESPPQTITNTFEEFTNCHKATKDFNNSDGSPSLLLSSHDEKNQEGITVGDDDADENNDNPLLVTALDWPKNVDPQMFIHDKNKERCVICNEYFIGRLVYHYVNEHRGCEIYNSRLSPSQITLVKQGRCEVTNASLSKSNKYYEAFCIFCQKNLRLALTSWYSHFTGHTGEFAYHCTGCGLRRTTPYFKNHHAQGCPGARVSRDLFFRLKSFQFEANVCNLCNYVQLLRNNIEKHLHMQHDLEQILPEHIQIIVILSIPPFAMATSRRWNNSGAAQSLLCSDVSKTCDIDDDDNNGTFEKSLSQETLPQTNHNTINILPEESPPQTNSPTINNTFEEFPYWQKTTIHLTNTDSSPSSLLFLDALTTHGIDDNGDDNDFIVEKILDQQNIATDKSSYN